MTDAIRDIELNIHTGEQRDSTYRRLQALFTFADTHPVTRDHPVTSKFREYKGVGLPPDATRLLALARRARKLRHQSRDETDRAELATQATLYQIEALAIAKKVVNNARARHVATIERAFTKSPKGLFKRIRQATAGTSHAPERPAEAVGPFIKHYNNLLASPDMSPIGPSSKFWERYIPALPPNSPKIWHKFHWAEVYLSLFPTSKAAIAAFDEMGGHTPQCPPTCTACNHFSEHSKAHDADPATTTPPKWMVLHTGRATGTDLIDAEMLRHFKSDDHWQEETEDFRVSLCKLLATFFDACVTLGPPRGLPDVILSALAKIPKSGISPDPLDFDKTRGISVHNTLAKLLEILIDVRFIHGVVTNRIVTTFQAGFMPHRSLDQCLFMAIEVVRTRWREDKDTWLLFLDFVKAYDNISPSAMWIILTKIGIPPAIINYVKLSYEARDTHLVFNGNFVDTLKQLTGLPQGGVLSCLLFNLFVESLSRFIESHPDIRGVSITTPGGTFTILHQLFADDMMALQETRGGIARLASVIQKWCITHGLSINVSGVEKSAVTYMSALPSPIIPSDISVATELGDFTIPCTDSYKYLGLTITTDLNPVLLQNQAIQRLSAAAHLFTDNHVIRRCSFRTQRTFFLSAVIGAISSTAAVIPPDAKFEAKVDNILKGIAAHIFRISISDITEDGLTDIRILPAAALILRYREMFRLKLLAIDVPASSLMRVIHSCDDTPQTRMSRTQTDDDDDDPELQPRLTTWCQHHYDLLHRLGFAKDWRMSLQMGLLKLWYVRYEAHTTANLAAHTDSVAQVIRFARARTLLIARKPHKAALPPAPHQIAINLHQLDTRVNILPHHDYYRPSLYGPGTGGSILSYTSALPHIFLWLHRARMGREGIFLHPAYPARPPHAKLSKPPNGTPGMAIIAPPRRVAGATKLTPAERAATKAATKAAKEATAAALVKAEKTAQDTRTITRARVAYSPTCEACLLTPTNGGDLAHFCTTCPAPQFAMLRAALFDHKGWADIITAVVDGLYDARKSTTPQYITSAIHRLDYLSPEGLFITRRVVMSAPWSAAMTHPDWALSRYLGLQFECDIPKGRAHLLADPWAYAAHEILSTVCTDWWKTIAPDQLLTLHIAGHWTPAFTTRN